MLKMSMIVMIMQLEMKVNASNESNMQLESLIAEIDIYDEEFLHCGKSSLQLNDNIYESDRISNN